METLQSIFTQLGIDSSIFYQFLIIVVVFILSKYAFLDKLQFVIEHRENKTLKLEQGADKVLEEATQLSEKYQSIIEDAHQKAQSKFSEKRQEILEKEQAVLKGSEEEIAKFVDQSRKEFLDEIEQKRKLIMANADSLAELLVNKISK